MEITFRVFILATLTSDGMAYQYDEFICKRITNDMKDIDTNFTVDNYHVAERDRDSMTATKSDLLSKPYARDFLDLFDKEERRDGVYRMSPDGGCPFDVYCDMTNGGWTVMQRRKDGSISFKRNWKEYVDGFDDLEEEFWLGPDTVHRLTKVSSQIYIHLQKYDENWLYAHHPEFTVHNAATSYKMNVDKNSFQETIPELLSMNDNMKFSTHERDNDNYSGHCSGGHGDAGWWFKACKGLNPNGMYNLQSVDGMAFLSGSWTYFKNSVIELKRNKRC